MEVGFDGRFSELESAVAELRGGRSGPISEDEQRDIEKVAVPSVDRHVSLYGSYGEEHDVHSAPVAGSGSKIIGPFAASRGVQPIDMSPISANSYFKFEAGLDCLKTLIDPDPSSVARCAAVMPAVDVAREMRQEINAKKELHPLIR